MATLASPAAASRRNPFALFARLAQRALPLDLLLLVQRLGIATIFLLSGWLGEKVPGLQSLDHGSGHLWQELFGWEGDPHLNPLHLLSNLVIGAGLYLLYRAWRVLYAAQHEGRLASTGPYARLRHPQYVGFLAVMVGFLLQWPTVLTLLMFPVLVVVYWRLARKEEQILVRQFGTAYQDYARRVPGFLPRFRRQTARS